MSISRSVHAGERTNQATDNTVRCLWSLQKVYCLLYRTTERRVPGPFPVFGEHLPEETELRQHFVIGYHLEVNFWCVERKVLTIEFWFVLDLLRERPTNVIIYAEGFGNGLPRSARMPKQSRKDECVLHQVESAAVRSKEKIVNPPQ